jgi:phosphatidylglycerophosphatase A
MDKPKSTDEYISNFPKEIQIDKAKADIPNFYKIIDDVLAGVMAWICLQLMAVWIL